MTTLPASDPVTVDRLAQLPGAERPTLAFAHANGFTGACYTSLLAPLAAQFDLLPVDRLAHDPAYPVGRNLTALRDEWLACLDTALGPVTASSHRKVIGVGHSLGGVLNYMAALKQPERFHCVILLDPPLMLGRDAMGLKIAKRFGFIDRVTPAGRTRGRRARWDSRQAMHDYLRRRSLFSRFTSEALDDYIDHATHRHDDGSLSLSFDTRHEVDIFRHLSDHLTGSPARLAVPALILAGEHSDLLTAPRQTRLRRAGLEVLTVPGGHMYPFENPEETRVALLAAIEQLMPQVLA
ncbi:MULTISPECIES: alpha/beta fold hydrolase [Cobetia]|uniref:Alpha/beta hydrolase n=1 Tax=Cobetia crustatorum TaxID=553385 RepID=A0A558HX32_9GAMM|nr:MULTISPECIES: alpha/beta hydrolase [Cobetia]TVU73659.1 alpha/beta hydrolase [Cobetia crustatorum]